MMMMNNEKIQTNKGGVAWPDVPASKGTLGNLTPAERLGGSVQVRS